MSGQGTLYRPAMPFGNRKKMIFSVQYCLNLKKYYPSGNLKFYGLGILKSLKFRISVKKILTISIKLNFTPNTLGCKGLKDYLARGDASSCQ